MAQVADALEELRAGKVSEGRAMEVDLIQEVALQLCLDNGSYWKRKVFQTDDCGTCTRHERGRINENRGFQLLSSKENQKKI